MVSKKSRSEVRVKKHNRLLHTWNTNTKIKIHEKG